MLNDFIHGSLQKILRKLRPEKIKKENLIFNVDPSFLAPTPLNPSKINAKFKKSKILKESGCFL
jgi:hypothetical protein